MHRGEPVAVGQTHVQRRLRRRQCPLVALPDGRDALDHLQQLAVVAGREGTILDPAVGILDPDPVVAEHHDVLHVRVVGDGLEPTQPEQVGQNRVVQRLLVVVPDVVPGDAPGVDVRTHHPGGDVLADGAPVVRADIRRGAELRGQQSRSLLVQRTDHCVVEFHSDGTWVHRRGGQRRGRWPGVAVDL